MSLKTRDIKPFLPTISSINCIKTALNICSVTSSLIVTNSSGTAAIIAPIGLINYQGKDYTYCNGDIGKITNELYNYLTGIQFGKSEDEFKWMTEI